jgi:hypothetical protein
MNVSRALFVVAVPFAPLALGVLLRADARGDVPGSCSCALAKDDD